MIRFIERSVKWFEDIFKNSSTERTESDKDSLKSVASSASPSSLQWLQLKLQSFVRLLRKRRGLVFRGFICWIFGLLAYHLDEVRSYDFRLSLRGDQDASQEIVIVDINSSDFVEFFPQKRSVLALKDDGTLSFDSRFWNPVLWREVLAKILSMEPKTVGVNFFFEEKLSRDFTPAEKETFTDPRIVWMGAISQGSPNQLPPFANLQTKNFGYAEFFRDDDGVFRSLPLLNPHYPSFPVRLAEKALGTPSITYPSDRAILNFRGGGQSFTHISFRQLMTAEAPEHLFKDKIIIIGSGPSPNTSMTSPVGQLSRSELLAHMTDNVINHRWIYRLPKAAAFGELFLVMLISVFLLNFFPQKVAFVFLSLLGLLLSTLSIWFFDTFYIWTPAFSPLVQIISTWMLFVGYLASKIERINWQLEHEKNSLAQLEQLKNNFISLISHDLKTPIAKIQAIVDRLLLSEHSSELTKDLKSLRGSSQELNRYIQSILQILRVESRDFHLNIEVADINDLVQRACLQIKPLAYEKHIFIRTQLEPLFSVEVDPVLIQEVFSNILENAVKYSPKGGSVFVETREVDQSILIRIRDTGEGISPTELENVFGKFVRGKNQDLKTKGSGLGLYLVKYFIELHGGRVSIASHIGKGTTLDVYLPTEN